MKIAYAGVNNVSYERAAYERAEPKIGPEPIERLVKRIGRERIDRRDVAVAGHRQYYPAATVHDRGPGARGAPTCPGMAHEG